MKIFRITLPVLCLSVLAVGVALAQTNRDPDWDKRSFTPTLTWLLHLELADLVKARKPVFFASCLETRRAETAGGQVNVSYLKHMIFIPPGATNGKYDVISWDKGQKAAKAYTAYRGTVQIRPVVRHAMVNFVDQGGDYQITMYSMNSEYLLRRKMALVYPTDFYSAMTSKSETNCPDWDVDISSFENVTRFYKARGWDRPLPLPSASSAARAH
jgi:hypothetical protein